MKSVSWLPRLSYVYIVDNGTNFLIQSETARLDKIFNTANDACEYALSNAWIIMPSCNINS